MAEITKEEYEKAKEDIVFYKSEYEWITSRESSEALKEIREEAQKIRAMINTERSKEQLYYHKYYNTLTVKEYLVEQGQYATVLLEGIQNLVARVKQYEIDSQEFTLRDILKSMIGKDEATKEARETNGLLQKVRIDGLPEEVNLSLQSPEQILSYMRKYSNLVGITIPDKAEQSTDLVISKSGLTRTQEKYLEFVNGIIFDKEPSNSNEEVSNKENGKQSDEEKGVDGHNNIRKVNFYGEGLHKGNAHKEDLHKESLQNKPKERE